MYSDKMINQIYYEKLNSINARNRIQRDLKYAVSEQTKPVIFIVFLVFLLMFQPKFFFTEYRYFIYSEFRRNLSWKFPPTRKFSSD